MEVVVSLSQGRTAAAQCGLFTHKSVPVIFEPPCIWTGVHKMRVMKCEVNVISLVVCTMCIICDFLYITLLIKCLNVSNYLK